MAGPMEEEGRLSTHCLVRRRLWVVREEASRPRRQRWESQQAEEMGTRVDCSVRVEGGDEDDGRAEVEDCGGDGGVHGGWVLGGRRAIWSLGRR